MEIEWKSDDMKTRSTVTKAEPGSTAEVNDLDEERESSSVCSNLNMLRSWEAYREYEQQRLESVKLLTSEEMTKIDQWLLDLHQIYEEVHYPMANRIWQTISYLEEEERAWYAKVKDEIRNDWFQFGKKLKQHINEKGSEIKEIPPQVRNLPRVDNAIQVDQYYLNRATTAEAKLSLSSNIAATVAREIIKSPTYFRGSKDDVIDWLKRLEQRFKMAEWNDELKLKYISVHLQEDAYCWWSRQSTKFTSWSSFVEAIKRTYGSTKLKERTFDQLRTYQQGINQSVTQYYNEVMELCQRIDAFMPDSMILQYLTSGVKQSLKLHVSLHDPQSPEAFLEYAMKVEDSLASFKPDHNSNQYESYPPQPQAPTPHYTNIPRNNKPVHTTPSGTATSKQATVICYSCGTPGHYSRECTRNHFQ